MTIYFPLSLLMLTAVLMTASTTSSAQSKSERKGDQHLESMAYAKATSLYLKAYNEDESNDLLKLKLARCHQLMNNAEQTVLWYSKVIDNTQVATPDDKFDYAMALMQLGDMEEAKKQFQTYSREVPSDERPVKFISQLEDISSLMNDTSRYELKPASFNSSFSDFSPTYYGEKVVFASSRLQSREHYRDGHEFSDLYVSTKNRLGVYGNAVPFDNAINTMYHEGPLQFYDEQRKLVLTGNNAEGERLIKSSTGIARLKLHFYLLDEEGNWVASEPFSHNSIEHSVGHPAISEDGKTLYFASDMPGGFGGTDLYVSHYVDSKWTKPQNLGRKINTKGNEMFPFLLNESTLYFASNGQGGLGGLDIFECELVAKEIRNMGMPINSSRDDFGFVMNEELQEGFVSSNRASSTGRDDDIYHFKILKPLTGAIETSIVDAETGAPIEKAMVSWEEFGGKSYAAIPSTLSGGVKLKMKLQHQYKVIVAKEGYRQSESFITPQDETDTMTIELIRK